jgi:hypothetical protein
VICDVLRQFRLPDGVTWRAATAATAAPGTTGFLAFGSVFNGMLLLRGKWGNTQSTCWKHDDTAQSPQFRARARQFARSERRARASSNYLPG